MKRIEPKVVRESVWDYLFPLKLKPTTQPAKISFDGEIISENFSNISPKATVLTFSAHYRAIL
jgi:hypothetical protein